MHGEERWQPESAWNSWNLEGLVKMHAVVSAGWQRYWNKPTGKSTPSRKEPHAWVRKDWPWNSRVYRISSPQRLFPPPQLYKINSAGECLDYFQGLLFRPCFRGKLQILLDTEWYEFFMRPDLKFRFSSSRREREYREWVTNFSTLWPRNNFFARQGYS